LTKEEYDARYKKPIAGFQYLAIEREKKPFLFSSETWLMIALSIGMAAFSVFFAGLPGVSAGWGRAGLAALIFYGMLWAAGIMMLGLQIRNKRKNNWARILSLVISAAIAIVVFAHFSLPPIRDIGEKPVTGTFRVTKFVTYRRSFTEDMVAVEMGTGQVVQFPISTLSRDEKILREKLKSAQPVITVTYYPHSKVRTHMEY